VTSWLLLHGTPLTPAMCAMSSRVRDARFVVLEDAWHMSIFTDPTRLAALLRSGSTPV
jgi:hypothetical protein